MTEPFNLSESGLQAVAEFLSHSDNLASVLDASNQEAASAGLRSFSERVASRSHVPFGSTFAILKFLSNAQLLAESTEQSLLELLDGFTASVNLNDGGVLPVDYIARWNVILPTLRQYMSAFGDSPLFTTMKAYNLVTQRLNLVSGTRIITELRPVFDAAGEEILEMVITHSLMIRYDDGDEVEFALDGDDVQRLQEQCARAQIKAKSLIESVKGQKWRTIEFPEKT